VQQVGERAWHAGTVAERPSRLASAARKPKLLHGMRVRETMRSRHYSRGTERSYCIWVKRFILLPQRAKPEGKKEGTIRQTRFGLIRAGDLMQKLYNP